MKGKGKLALIGMATILALSLLGFGLGTTVFASEEESTDGTTDEATTSYETFLGKVAEKLGLQYDVVEEAFQEARQEMMQEALQERLQEAVQDGRITQEEADQILQWMQDRPEALDQLDGFGSSAWRGGWMTMGGHHRCRDF